METYKKLENGAAVITPQGVLMGGSESEVLNKVLLEIENNCIRECIIDLRNIKWINSPAVGLLLKRRNSYGKRGKDLRIININSRVKNYLHMTKLLHYFK